MNARIAAMLVAVLFVLGGGALVYYQQERARQASNVSTLGQLLLPDLKAAAIAQVRLRGPQASISLDQKGEAWSLAERRDFPVDVEKVRALVLKMVGLKVGQSEPIGAADRARLQLAESGEGAATRVEFLDAAGKPLASLLVGKKYFKGAPPEDAAKAAGDGRFVMRPAAPETVFVVSDPLAEASLRSADWIDRRGASCEKVKTMQVARPDGSGWTLSRDDDNAAWRLDGLQPGEKIEVTRANATTYSMSLLEIADVAPPGTTDEQTGLATPTRVTAQTLDGLNCTLLVGRPEGDSMYAKIAIEGSPAKARAPVPEEKPEDSARRDKEHAERIAKIEARLPRERALAGYTLLIAKSKLEDILRKREELLERKDERK